MTTSTGTVISEIFGVKWPIVQGAMGGVAGPALVAAVANAGGLGILPIWARPLENAAAMIAEVNALTDRPFAVNLRADLVQLEHIEMAIEAGVSLFSLFWGNPAPSMSAVNAGGGRLIATIGDVESARQALDVGASALIAQGIEAGGHVKSETPLDVLLGDVLGISHDIPVIAAGGITTPEDVHRVLSRGASAALLGTRFAATQESEASQYYKKALVNAAADATVRTTCFDGMWPDAPHRVLRNSTYENWNAAGQPPNGQRPGEDDVILQVGELSFPRYSMMPPVQHMAGDFEAAAMYAGCGVADIHSCPTVEEIMSELVSLVNEPAT